MTTRPPQTVWPSHARVVFLIATHGALMDSQLERRYYARYTSDGWPYAAPSSLRTRREELVGWGVLSASLEPGQSPSHRRSNRWELASPAPLAIAQGHAGDFPEALSALAVEAGNDVVVRAALADLGSMVGVRL